MTEQQITDEVLRYLCEGSSSEGQSLHELGGGSAGKGLVPLLRT